MRSYRYMKVDAFTSETSLGNPAACIFTGMESLTHETMLGIAKQHKGFVSEVVFCSASCIADYKLTYYSSECEVDFCGHGTIATMYELVRNDPILLAKPEIKIETNKKGILTLYNEITLDDSVYITAPMPDYITLPVTQEQTANALGLHPEAMSETHPMAFIDAGLRTLIVPLDSYQDEVSLFPEIRKLKIFCDKNSIDIVLIYVTQTENESAHAHTRVFAPKYGYLEDPATGSGNSAFGYYMLKNALWDGSTISIEQGGKDRAFNMVKLALKDVGVVFGGRATLRIDGHYFL